MKQFQKPLALLLSLVLCISLMFVPASATTDVVIVDGTGYDALATAIAAVKHNSTVELLPGATLNFPLTIDLNVTVTGVDNLGFLNDDYSLLTLRAGTYDKDVTDFCADGFKCVAQEDGTYYVTQKVELPAVSVTDIKNSLTESDPLLTFALNFGVEDYETILQDQEYLQDLMNGYGYYYTDYVLTIDGLSESDVTFDDDALDADNTADGYLSGRYAAYEGGAWLDVPFDPVTINNGENLYIMSYAADLMNKQDLRFTLEEIATIVVSFDCGIYFTDEFLAANPDMEVTLELKIFTEDANGQIVDNISLATRKFHKHNLKDVPAVDASCTESGNIKHFACQHTGCGKLFEDEAAAKELTAEEVTVKASHKLNKEDKVEATYTAPGTMEHYLCSVCKKTFSDADGKTPITNLEIPQLVKVEDSKAEVSEGAMDAVIEESDATGDVKLDLTDEKVVGEKNKSISSADLPVVSLEKVADADASLTLTKADATVTLDTKALEAVAKQAEGTTVTLVVEEIKAEELSQSQQAAIKEKEVAAVISVELICKETNKPICTEAAEGFSGGTVTVKIPFTPETGYKGSDYVIVYVADDGTTEALKTDYKDGYLIAVLKHFSDYVVVNTAAEDETQPTEPTVPETTVPETTVPETTVPETTVPETTVPETTVPETTVPETTVPETTVPETTVPATTAPQATTKPSNPTVPHTGDNSSVTGMMLVMLASGAAMAGLWLTLRKKAM